MKSQEPSEESSTGTVPRMSLAPEIESVVAAVRTVRPRVHALTSPVAATLTANLLLAVESQPSLTSSAPEVVDFVRSADALLINLGMLDAERTEAIEALVPHLADRRWVLDPVQCHRSPQRLARAQALLALDPDVVRGNADEIAALGAAVGSRISPVPCVVTSGAVDRITDATGTVEIVGGHPWMDATTAMGCAGTAVVAAFLACAPPRQAAVAAMTVLGQCGQWAGQQARGPGSFVPAFVDALYGCGRASC